MSRNCVLSFLFVEFEERVDRTFAWAIRNDGRLRNNRYSSIHFTFYRLWKLYRELDIVLDKCSSSNKSHVIFFLWSVAVRRCWWLRFMQTPKQHVTFCHTWQVKVSRMKRDHRRRRRRRRRHRRRRCHRRHNKSHEMNHSSCPSNRRCWKLEREQLVYVENEQSMIDVDWTKHAVVFAMSKYFCYPMTIAQK